MCRLVNDETAGEPILPVRLESIIKPEYLDEMQGVAPPSADQSVVHTACVDTITDYALTLWSTSSYDVDRALLADRMAQPGDDSGPHADTQGLPPDSNGAGPCEAENPTNGMTAYILSFSPLNCALQVMSQARRVL